MPKMEMKILIIDSHKGSLKEPDNLHWLNADCIRRYFIELGHEVKLIWSYPTVNERLEKGFERIVFNHASAYSYVDWAWATQSPEAPIYYLENEYNLGEPRALWKVAKTDGRKYTVISNHEASISKIVQKYVKNWYPSVNLNSLIIRPEGVENSSPRGCIYYGSFRRGRLTSFQKYSGKEIVFSTHVKNRKKFLDSGLDFSFIDRISWRGEGLKGFKTSLYLEDDLTHSNFNCLANRFYEAINYNVLPIFDSACDLVLSKSGYDVPAELICSSKEEALDLTERLLPNLQALEEWRLIALKEKSDTLEKISDLVIGGK